ncbi:MAG TPA: tRNA lysidine(34) synthetase TilS [Pyrinomonadaceae bacterium]|nr:tRNA lysidine(34) synthetase TilS [Pyrinomonadaceae bacterium]
MKKPQHEPARDDALTKPKLSGFARRLSQAWKRLALPVTNERVVVAVSGGADSVALLLAFDELNKSGRMSLVLKVAHLDHGLRGEAGAEDARWVAELACALGYEFELGRTPVAERASEARDNLEQAARRARYEFLGRVGRAWAARAVVVGHTLDDQAETLLLALLRGSGARGLGGMRELRGFQAACDELLLVRPLLEWARRAETLKYCESRGVQVRADAMNEDERFARVRVRSQLIPQLETFNPRAVETLARTAGLLRAEADALEALGGQLLIEAYSDARLKMFEKAAVGDETEDALPLSVEVLRGASEAVVKYALRGWIAAGRGSLRRIESVHVEAVARLLTDGRGGRVAELPGGGRVERRRGLLLFHAGSKRAGKS